MCKIWRCEVLVILRWNEYQRKKTLHGNFEVHTSQICSVFSPDLIAMAEWRPQQALFEKNGPEEGKITTKVNCEIELKWRPKEESLSWDVWGPYLPDSFRFPPELIAPTTLWLKQALFDQKRTPTWEVMAEEGLVLLDVGCAAADPFVELFFCGAERNWRWCVSACLVVLPMSRT